MDQGVLIDILQKVKNGTATLEEKEAVLKELNTVNAKLNGLLGDLKDSIDQAKK